MILQQTSPETTCRERHPQYCKQASRVQPSFRMLLSTKCTRCSFPSPSTQLSNEFKNIHLAAQCLNLRGILSVVTIVVSVGGQERRGGHFVWGGAPSRDMRWCSLCDAARLSALMRSLELAAVAVAASCRLSPAVVYNKHTHPSLTLPPPSVCSAS